MEDYETLLAVGIVILVSPFIHPLLVMVNGFLPLMAPIGFLTIISGVIVMVSERD